MTLSEVYYNKNAMYIAMSLYSEEPFPEDIKIKDHVKDYILNFDQAAISGENTFSFMPDEKTFLFNYMEGKFVDDHTFAGMLRVDLSSLETEPTDTFTCHMALASRLRMKKFTKETGTLILMSNWIQKIHRPWK